MFKRLEFIKLRFVSISFTAFIALCAPVVSAGPLEDVSGLWLIESERGHVEVADCGDGTPCGTLVWGQSDQDGDVSLDINNKKAELRTRPIIGLQIVYGFKLKKDYWKSGKIYNPEDGKTYGSSMRRLDNDTLEVKGCVGPICKTQIWTRLPVDVIKP